MAEMSMTYLEDGEWLSINTNTRRSGAYISIEPLGQDIVYATGSPPPVEVEPGVYDISEGWARMVSPAGAFTIFAPEDDRLKDWMLELTGMPRLFPKLKLGVMALLFGGEVVRQVELYHREFGSRRESVGDLLAKSMDRGALSMGEASAAVRSRVFVSEADVNAQTQNAREQLLGSAVEDSGRLVIARSVLIVE